MPRQLDRCVNVRHQGKNRPFSSYLLVCISHKLFIFSGIELKLLPGTSDKDPDIKGGIRDDNRKMCWLEGF